MALITDHAADQRIAEIINREFLAADEVRQHFDWEWDEAIDFYMQLMQMDMPEGAEWFSAELLNEFFISIESVTPKLPCAFNEIAPTLPRVPYLFCGWPSSLATKASRITGSAKSARRWCRSGATRNSTLTVRPFPALSSMKCSITIRTTDLGLNSVT